MPQDICILTKMWMQKTVCTSLQEYLQHLFAEEYDALSLARREPPAIAVNPCKCDRELLAKKLSGWKLSYQAHPVHPDGFILAEDPLPLSHTLAYFNGEFRHQGISSQLPVLALEPQPGETVLDLSAAPGGKSVQIAGLMRNQGRLLLNDASSKRLEPLMANLSRAAVLNDVIIHAPGQMVGRVLPEFFDRVLVDAPCSGLNFAADRWRTGRWNQRYLETMSKVQEQLLISAIKAVKVNGIIVYSTCSLAPEENEMVISRLLDRYPLIVEPLPCWQIPSSRSALTQYQNQVFNAEVQQGLRILPFPEPMEGFFIIRLRKMARLPIRPGQQLSWLPTRPAHDPLIRAILLNLQELWGVDAAFFDPYRFWVNEHKLWITNSSWLQVPVHHFVKTGLALALRKTGFWRLTNAGVQWLGEQVTRAKIELLFEQLALLLANGELAYPGEALRYYILTYKQKPIGVVSQCNGVMKIKTPHRFRLIDDPLISVTP